MPSPAVRVPRLGTWLFPSTWQGGDILSPLSVSARPTQVHGPVGWGRMQSSVGKQEEACQAFPKESHSHIFSEGSAPMWNYSWWQTECSLQSSLSVTLMGHVGSIPVCTGNEGWTHNYLLPVKHGPDTESCESAFGARADCWKRHLELQGKKEQKQKQSHTIKKSVFTFNSSWVQSRRIFHLHCK